MSAAPSPSVPPDGSIWYIHSSAGGPGLGSYMRPYELARAWQDQGLSAVVISPGYHHLMEGKEPLDGPQSIGGVRYFFTKPFVYSGNGIRRILAMFILMLMVVLQARSISRYAGKPAVIIASSPHPFGLISALILRLVYGCRVVFEVRDIWPASIIELTGKTQRNPFVWLLARIESLAMKRSDAVVSLLEHALPHMQSRGLDPARFHWIPNGVAPIGEIADRTSPHDALLQSLRQKGQLAVIYAGTLGVANNLGLLLDVAQRLRAQGDDRFAFVIVGDGVYRAELEKRISDQQLTNVHLLTKVRRNALIGMLDQCSIGFISLADSPLFALGVSPNKVFDYMLAQLPVLFAIRTPSGVVERAQCGYSCAPEIEPILAALQAFSRLTPAERKAMGQKGREHVETHYAYHDLASRYATIFARISNSVAQRQKRKSEGGSA